jgi:hypothetical protein
MRLASIMSKTSSPTAPTNADRQFIPEELAEWRRKVAEEEAARPANLARLQRMDEAAAEQTFSGELRRAIRAAKVPHHDLAERIGVSWRQLLDFQTGDAALPTDAVDRLIRVLSLTARLEAKTP